MPIIEKRRYKRYTTPHGYTAMLNIAIDEITYIAKLNDISKGGLSIIVDIAMQKVIKENMRLENVEILLNDKLIGSLNLIVVQIRVVKSGKEYRVGMAKAADAHTAALLWEIIYRRHSLVTKQKEVERKVLKSKDVPKIPGRGTYTEKSRHDRLAFIQKKTGADLTQVQENTLNPTKLVSNIENFIGTVEIPVGVAGPLKIVGPNASGIFYIPLATSEGALVASASRGAAAITRSGGATARVLSQRMMRVPLFAFKDLDQSLCFAEWVRDHFDEIKTQTKKYSNFADLIELEPKIIGREVHVQFVYLTGDASGQNMTTTCTWHACLWILEQIKHLKIHVENFIVEGNLSNDKKVTFQSFIKGRGIRATSEVFLSAEILETVLKVTPHQLFSAYQGLASGALQAGMVGLNVNVANIVAGVFTAMGQDIASVHESAIGHLHMEPTEGGIYASMLMPSLIVGTVGGGTSLPQQRECLEMVGCAGTGHSFKLAEIIVSLCLSLDLSTLSAIASGQFASAHEKLGRNRPVDFLKRHEINPQFFTNIMQSNIDDKSLTVTHCEPINGVDLGSSIITELTANKSAKLLGHFPFRLKYTSEIGDSGEKDVMLKIKPTDKEVILMINGLGAMCDARLAQKLRDSNGKTGFVGCHIRELAVYEEQDERFVKHVPEIYGVYRDDEREIYTIIQEFLKDMVLMDSADDISGWEHEHIESAINGIAAVHSIWYGREEELKAKEWIGHPLSVVRMAEFSQLWEFLAIHANIEFPEWFGTDDLELYQKLIDGIPVWWGRLENMKKTLIHNDFNPRNILFRPTDKGLRLCAYDWELATIHVPQHDIAELLVFTLQGDFSLDTVKQYVEYHRVTLEKYIETPIDPDEWWDGFTFSVYDLAINRIATYMMAHTAVYYGFMQRVYQTLRRLIDLLIQDQEV